MELRDYIAIGRKWFWLFALATVVAATGAWVAARFAPKQYMSQTTLMVGRATDNPDPLFQNIYLSQQLASTYAQVATRQPVLEGVVTDLELNGGWEALRGMVQARQVPNAQLIEIRVVDSIPERARSIADSVADNLILQSPTPSQQVLLESQEFVERQTQTLQAKIDGAEAELAEIEAQIALQTSARAIADLQTRKSARESQLQLWRSQHANYMSAMGSGEVNSLWVVEPATPARLTGGRTSMNVLLAGALGFGLALGAVMLLEFLDDTIKTVEDAERRLGLTGLATIERVTEVEHRRDGLLTVLKPRSPVAEAFRVLRTNLQFSLLGKDRTVLVVTSPNPGEGKSTTAANLAVVMAQGGTRVVLVDSDLRRPSLHRFFDMSNSVGMTTLLLDPDLPLEHAVRDVEDVPGLRVLTSGPLPPNPAEVLDSAATRQFIERIAQDADTVILDSPPLLVVADGAILSSYADGTLLVFDSAMTRTEAAKRALQALNKVGVSAVGAVINKLDRSKVGGYYYYYAYQYRYYSSYYGHDGSDEEGDDAAPGAGRGPDSGGLPGVIDRLRESVASLLG